MNIDISNGTGDNFDVVISYKKSEDSHITVPHMHSRYELYYNISGAKAFMCDGKVYPCSERNLIVVPGFCAHKVFAHKEANYERCIVSVDEAFVDMISMLCKSEECLSWMTDSKGLNISCIQLSPEQHQTFMLLVNKYLDGQKSQDKLRRLAYFIRILSFITKCFETAQNSMPIDAAVLTPAENAMVLIEQKFKTITLSEVCAALYFSEDHLNRLFKSEMEMTIKQYIIIRKLTEAKKHLYTGKSAKEACFLSGFRDYSNFRRTFKNYEGYNPGNLDELTSPI